MKTKNIKNLWALVLFVFSMPLAMGSDMPKTALRPVGYIAVVHPLLSVSKSESSQNFSNSYQVGFPFGIHLPKTEKFGFSLELVPFILADSAGSSVSNLLIHPGVFYRLPHQLSVYGRLAFESSGRFGFTPSISKTFYKGRCCNAYATLPFPMRFGKGKESSAGLGFQMGISF